jgi:hypothetical protein
VLLESMCSNYIVHSWLPVPTGTSTYMDYDATMRRRAARSYLRPPNQPAIASLPQ